MKINMTKEECAEYLRLAKLADAVMAGPAPCSAVVVPREFLSKPPAAIKHPCDYGLEIAVQNLVTQLGTVEAFNRITSAAWALRDEIEAGRIKQPIPGTAEPLREHLPNAQPSDRAGLNPNHETDARADR